MDDGLNSSLDELVASTAALATEQGGILLDRWRSIGPLSYKNRRDFATEMDVEVENNIKAALTARFPLHGFSGEETRPERSEARYQWLIDPIDGTKYYAAQVPIFSVSIALLLDAEPIMGVVHVPASAQTFAARKGGGAFLDGHRLRGSTVAGLPDVIVNVDTPNSDRLSTVERQWFENRPVRLTSHVYRVRAIGVGSLAACWLATGALDAYVDLTGYVKPPDIAAGRIIMQEAGLRLEYIDPGAGPRRLLSAPPHLWDELHQLLMRASR